MRIIDKFGNNILNMFDIEPYEHFVEFEGNKRIITKIVFSLRGMELEWGDPIENLGSNS